jgi:hypothetical protein
VSSAIVRDMRTYDAALEHFSRPLCRSSTGSLLPPDDKMIVDGQTDHLYRLFRRHSAGRIPL